ncbi:hypothetical protein VFPBJ_03191 [Purpureocillium lilacinum]|uniref:Uncharacterized protein n=1 Tax=Purpureocillium lilacinum TaxID=33203 RepID=A0A179H4K0_PURLI|nr:hypothetical protein VFPBJ_03191 [Purpureocillium lilacinum]
MYGRTALERGGGGSCRTFATSRYMPPARPAAAAGGTWQAAASQLSSISSSFFRNHYRRLGSSGVPLFCTFHLSLAVPCGSVVWISPAVVASRRGETKSRFARSSHEKHTPQATGAHQSRAESTAPASAPAIQHQQPAQDEPRTPGTQTRQKVQPPRLQGTTRRRPARQGDGQGIERKSSEAAGREQKKKILITLSH